MMEALRRFAFARPTAFAIPGEGGREALRAMLAEGWVRETPAPHDADLLLLAGTIPETWQRPLCALFETMALPRLAVWLRTHGASAPQGLPLIEVGPEGADREAVLARLLDPDAANNRPILADEPPTPWRGEGDHGQGGEGMMGGKPYGRPMAMTGGDADGLMLGALPTSLGPFFPGLPTELEIRLTLQGDRISSVEEVANWFSETAADAEPAPVAAADTERRQIRRHLDTMAAMLRFAGLDDLGRRCRFANSLDPRHLRRRLRAAERRGLRYALEGVGRIGREHAKHLGLTGHVARASTEGDGDAWARWTVLRDEVLQAAERLSQPDRRSTGNSKGQRDGTNESRANLGAVADMLPGLLWSEALLSVASLGLDMEEAAGEEAAQT